MKVLHLTLKSKFYDMIAYGDKLEEYREIKPFWVKRLFRMEVGMSNEDYYPEEICNELIKFQDELKNIPKCFGVHIIKYDFIRFARGGHFHPSLPQMTVEYKGLEVGSAPNGLTTGRVMYL